MKFLNPQWNNLVLAKKSQKFPSFAAAFMKIKKVLMYARQELIDDAYETNIFSSYLCMYI